jgi:hypothetical protein
MAKFSFVTLCTLMLSFGWLALAQEPTPLPSPTASVLPVIVSAENWVDGHLTAILAGAGTVLAILFALAKAISNSWAEKAEGWRGGLARAIIKVNDAIFDVEANVVRFLRLVQKVLLSLSELLKSDGIGGKK